MEKHTTKEDWIAIITGTCLISQGICFLQAAHILTGGAAGLALLLHHLLPFSFGTLFFIINCPFYLLGWHRFGWRFAVNTIISGALVAVISDHLPLLVSLDDANPVYCALMGGLLMGLGLLILFRHRSSMGGFNILCLYIQDKFAISVGKTQLGIDASILLASFFFVDLTTIAVSVLSATTLNLVLAMNHKPERYKVSYNV